MLSGVCFLGSAWDIFEIVSVEKYFVEDKDETPFFQTAAGVAIVVLIVLLLVAAMAVGVIFLLRKARKHNWYTYVPFRIYYFFPFETGKDFY